VTCHISGATDYIANSFHAVGQIQETTGSTVLREMSRFHPIPYDTDRDRCAPVSGDAGCSDAAIPASGELQLEPDVHLNSAHRAISHRDHSFR
jgi:hypothetical protein